MRPALVTLGAVAFATACKGPPCTSQNDCSFGEYCDLEASTSGTLQKGECRKDCDQNSDCPQPTGNISYAVCSNQGQCETLDHPPKIHILEPEEDQHYPEGTKKIRISGEVKTAAALVSVSVKARNMTGCGGGAGKSVDLMNPNVGTFATLSFVLEDVEIDPGRTVLTLDARSGNGHKTSTVDVNVDCAGCAQISIMDPAPLASAPALELPLLSGSVMPLTVMDGIWRIFSAQGDVLDGGLPIQTGAYSLSRLPLFPGLNRVEVLVTGVGSALGESRCSALVSAGQAQESGIRMILIGDDPSADLAIHVIGPAGHFGEAMNTLSPRSRSPTFGGTIEDEGGGPQVAAIPMPPDGVYGIIIEPVIDGTGDGSNAVLHALYGGRLATPRPIGPRHLTALDGNLWIVGTVKVQGGTSTWTTIDTLVQAGMTPTTLPASWPMFH